VTRRRCSRLVSFALAFLAPSLVKAAVDGQLPDGVGVTACPNPRPVQRASQVYLLGRRYRSSSRLRVAPATKPFLSATKFQRNNRMLLEAYPTVWKRHGTGNVRERIHRRVAISPRSEGPASKRACVPDEDTSRLLHGRLFSRALRDATAMDETRGLESWNAQGDGGAIRILTRGPGSSLGFPDPNPPSDKKRIAPHACHR
jgi:hypothetical protein